MRRPGLILIIIGCLLLMSPMLGRLYSDYHQYQLRQRYAPAPTRTVRNRTTPRTAPGISPPFVLAIPAIGLNAVVINGIGSRELQQGPGLYPQSSLPGLEGNVSIAGHRDIYGAWFRYLNLLSVGDKIFISQNRRRITYKVEKIYFAAANDWMVVARTPYRALTLTTCDPPGHATRRLIVRARQMTDFTEEK